jgi:hypothetical protein
MEALTEVLAYVQSGLLAVVVTIIAACVALAGRLDYEEEEERPPSPRPDDQIDIREFLRRWE